MQYFITILTWKYMKLILWQWNWELLMKYDVNDIDRHAVEENR